MLHFRLMVKHARGRDDRELPNSHFVCDQNDKQRVRAKMPDVSVCAPRRRRQLVLGVATTVSVTVSVRERNHIFLR